MANRRKFITGLSALAAGSAAAVGTGAFTSTQADRDLTVAVADDASAYLGLEPAGSANSNAYASVGSNGQVSLDLSSTGNGGTGLNKNAETRIDELLIVSNQGTQTVNVWVDIGLGNVSGIDNSDLYFFPGDATDTRLNNGAGSETDEVLALTPGESATLGLFADIGDVSSVDTTVTAEVNANVDAGGSETVDDSGGSFAIVANDGSGDFSDIQTAIDNASGTTVVVKDTGTPYTISDSTLEINKEGLEIRGLDGKPTVEYQGGYPDSPSGSYANQAAISISAADVTLQGLRFEIFGIGTSGPNNLKITGGSPLVQITDVGTEMRNVDLSIEGTFDGPPGFVAFDVPASKGSGRFVFRNSLAEDNSSAAPNGNAFFSTSGLFRDSGFNPYTNSNGNNVSRRAVIRNSEFRNGIPLDGHPGQGQDIRIVNNDFTDEGVSPEAIQPAATGTIRIRNNLFDYTVSSGSNEKVKFTGFPSQVNGQSLSGAQQVADVVGGANTQADGSGGTEGAAVLVLAGTGNPANSGTYSAPE